MLNVCRVTGLNLVEAKSKKLCLNHLTRQTRVTEWLNAFNNKAASLHSSTASLATYTVFAGALHGRPILLICDTTGQALFLSERKSYYF